MEKSKPVKNSVALVIYNKDKTKFLIVKRPLDDEHLPGVWGLPATSLRKDESFEKAVIRCGREKLGVKVEIIHLINVGKIERQKHILQMKEFEIRILRGKPEVPQLIKGITQYTEWKWGKIQDLVDAARKGSLCSQLYLSANNSSW